MSLGPCLVSFLADSRGAAMWRQASLGLVVVVIVVVVVVVVSPSFVDYFQKWQVLDSRRSRSFALCRLQPRVGS